MIDTSHYVPLVHEDFALLVFDNQAFINEFHGIELGILLKPGEKDLRKPPFADAFQDLKARNINPLTVYPLQSNQIQRGTIKVRDITIVKGKEQVQQQIGWL